MTDIIEANSEEAVVEAIGAAAAAGRPIEIRGAGSKALLGRPMRTESALTMTGLSGVTAYEPEELVLTAWAGTPLAAIEDCLAAGGQALAFEPRDLSAVLGSAGAQTLGGVVATNLSGPRRCVGGAVRDHVLGLRAVNGMGELFKAGGKVVKNVTGYDLCKVLTGSFGTLAAFTEITVKVLPAAETEETLLVLGQDAAAAVRLMSQALGSSANPSAAAWLPGPLAARSEAAASAAGTAATCLRLEGFGPSVEARRRALLDRLGSGSQVVLLAAEGSRRLWRQLRDLLVFIPGRPDRHPDRALWKLALRPSDAPALVERLSRLDGAELFLDWGGGLAWLGLTCGDDAQAAAVRDAMPAGGHATLVGAPEAVRASQPVFQPLPPPLAALEARLKGSFDPKGILNPGRMVATA